MNVIVYNIKAMHFLYQIVHQMSILFIIEYFFLISLTYIINVLYCSFIRFEFELLIVPSISFILKLN